LTCDIVGDSPFLDLGLGCSRMVGTVDIDISITQLGVRECLSVKLEDLLFTLLKIDHPIWTNHPTSATYYCSYTACLPPFLRARVCLLQGVVRRIASASLRRSRIDQHPSKLTGKERGVNEVAPARAKGFVRIESSRLLTETEVSVYRIKLCIQPPVTLNVRQRSSATRIPMKLTVSQMPKSPSSQVD